MIYRRLEQELERRCAAVTQCHTRVETLSLRSFPQSLLPSRKLTTRPLLGTMVNVADTILALLPPQALSILPSYLTHYVPGVTPLSETQHVVGTLIGYLVTIFSIQFLMRDRQPMKLTGPFQAHNIFLTGISGLLLVLIAEDILPVLFKEGFFNAICSPRSWTPVRILSRLCFTALALILPL